MNRGRCATQPRSGGATSALVVAVSLLAAASLWAGEEPGMEYRLEISRSPERVWFECRRVAPDTAFVTDPDVAAYYPYRVSRGEEHVVIVRPAASMPIYWLEAERSYRGLLSSAAGSLQECSRLLGETEREVRERKKLHGKWRSQRPRWEEKLRDRKRAYLEATGREGFPLDGLDVLERWQELQTQKQELLSPAPPSRDQGERGEPAPEGGPVQDSEQGPQGETGGDRAFAPSFPFVGYLRAEPAPNDDGTHIAVRWPIAPSDLAARPRPEPAPEEQEEAAEPPTPPERQLTPGEEARLRGIERQMEALRPARRCALMLKQGEAKLAETREHILRLRDAFLLNLAAYAASFAAVQDESRVQLAALFEVETARLESQVVRRRMGDLNASLEGARAAAARPGAGAADYDGFDRLRYCARLAWHYLNIEEKHIKLADVEDSALGAMRRVLADVEPPAPDEQEDEVAVAAAREALAEALAGRMEAGRRVDTDPGALAQWEASLEALEEARQAYVAATVAQLGARLRGPAREGPPRSDLRNEVTRLGVLEHGASERLKQIELNHAGWRYFFRLSAVPVGGEEGRLYPHVASASARAGSFDTSKLTNLAFVLIFTGSVLFMIAYVRRRPEVFVRPIPGLEAVDEAIGRATEMGRPALFVHGLSGVGEVNVMASISILGRIARRIAEYDSDLLVVNNDPIVYSISHEVVQEGYTEAGRPDAFNGDNIFMAASDQFPYVAAVAGIMSRRRPAANFFMGYFAAESLILAEAGAMTGAVQIAATDSFTQIPFFITTCDYTLIGEELYAASAYLSREPRMLGTIKAQDVGKAILVAALVLGSVFGALGLEFLQIIFTAYEKVS